MSVGGPLLVIGGSPKRDPDRPSSPTPSRGLERTRPRRPIARPRTGDISFGAYRTGVSLSHLPRFIQPREHPEGSTWLNVLFEQHRHVQGTVVTYRLPLQPGRPCRRRQTASAHAPPH